MARPTQARLELHGRHIDRGHAREHHDRRALGVAMKEKLHQAALNEHRIQSLYHV
jgi:hypothetical protein